MEKELIKVKADILSLRSQLKSVPNRGATVHLGTLSWSNETEVIATVLYEESLPGIEVVIPVIRDAWYGGKLLSSSAKRNIDKTLGLVRSVFKQCEFDVVN